ncbi:hypothetical protein [Sphingomonas sp. MA1305]|uniref:hypothetical protein n=1 Tax=Sphingomonas sp. MA1305 TaxID=2479204 RepID=UPI0018DF15E3|nr:hypothetical protein [Sphingomonas sp. MA1305]
MTLNTRGVVIVAISAIVIIYGCVTGEASLGNFSVEKSKNPALFGCAMAFTILILIGGLILIFKA